MAVVPGSPEWQEANNVRPNGRGGWVSNTHLGQPFGWRDALPFALMYAGGFGAQALGPAAGVASGATKAGTTLTSAGLGTLPSYGATPAMYAAGAGLPTASMMTPAAAGGVNSMPWLKRAGNAVLGRNNSGGGEDVGEGGGGLLERILRQWLPLGLAGGSALMGLKDRGPTPAETQLQGLLNTAQRRVDGAEPLYQALQAMAMDDAGLAQRRRATAEPLLNSMATMANRQMPKYTREG